MSDDVLPELVRAQRRRCQASILGPMERGVKSKMTDEEWETVRTAVLGAVGVFADFTLDVTRAANRGTWVNDDAMRLLNDIHRQVSSGD